MKCHLETSDQEFSIEECKGSLFIKWCGHTLYAMNEKLLLHPISLIINALAYCLFPFAAKSVVFTSSRSFKKKCDPDRVLQSHQILQALGGEEIRLSMADGHQISAMYLDSKKCLDALVGNGAVKGKISLSGEDVQDVLWISPENKELDRLIKKMGLSLFERSGRKYLPIGLPKNSNSYSHQMAETVIYGPGSGHLFEFRRKTIGTFLIGYGMNMLVLHYSGTGQSEGKISEQSTYENMEVAYQYLVAKGISDDKILGYGHCMGGGPILDLASKHPINILIDRTFLNMGEFAKLRVIKVLHLPFFLHFLTSLIPPVMNKCFNYDNREKIQLVKGKVAVLGGLHDDLIPKEYIDELFEKAVLAKKKIQLFMSTNHDADLFQDETAHLPLGEFLTEGI